MTSVCDMVSQIMQKKEEDKRIVEDQATKDQYWKIPICYNDDDDEYSFATQEYLKKFSSDEVLDDIISIPPGNGNDHFNAESSLIESVLNHENVISSPKIDSHLEEFAGELAFIAPIPPGIVEADLDPKEDIRFIENLMYDNSFPRPSETLKDNSETVIDSNDDSTSSDDDSPYGEDIDYVDASPPDVEIVSLEVMDANNSLPEYDSFHFKIEPDQGELTNVVMEDILGEPRVHTPNVTKDIRECFKLEDSAQKQSASRGGKLVIPQDHEDPCLFSILQSSGLRSFVYSGILNPDHPSKTSDHGRLEYRCEQSFKGLEGTRYCSYEVAENFRWQYEVAMDGQLGDDTCLKCVIRRCQACVSQRR
ncbi:hypothetical protein Tco_0869525 [Tanacetum coccineum]